MARVRRLAGADGRRREEQVPAGIAMGLVQDKETGEYAVLSDILATRTTSTWTSKTGTEKAFALPDGHQNTGLETRF
jgi:hypothetical protein